MTGWPCREMGPCECPDWYHRLMFVAHQHCVTLLIRLLPGTTHDSQSRWVFSLSLYSCGKPSLCICSEKFISTWAMTYYKMQACTVSSEAALPWLTSESWVTINGCWSIPVRANFLLLACLHNLIDSRQDIELRSLSLRHCLEAKSTEYCAIWHTESLGIL